MRIQSVYDEAFRRYGRVWDGVPAALTEQVTEALRRATPCPAEGTAYVPSEPALEELTCASALKGALYGGRPAQLGWCNGHNTRLNCLEYHRASEFNLGTRDFILLVAPLAAVEGAGAAAVLDTARVEAFRAPAGVLVEVYATTLHYAPCQVDDEGFRVLVALPAGTNGPRPALPADAEQAGDAPLLWAADKWLLAHSEAPEAVTGAHVGLAGANIDIAPLIA